MNQIRRFSVKHLKHDTLVQDRFKNAMASVASQAMILTAGFKSSRSTDSHKTKTLHGMTLSSVSSLSVYPNPLLHFNLQLPSYTSKTLHDNEGIVAIHMLKSTPKAGELGRIFASGIKKLGITQGADGEIFHEMATPFKRIDRDDWKFLNYRDYTIPILKESEQIFVCNKKTVLEIDNHEIWVVNVLDVLQNSNEQTGGLIYYDRAFHTVGDIIKE